MNNFVSVNYKKTKEVRFYSILIDRPRSRNLKINLYTVVITSFPNKFRFWEPSRLFDFTLIEHECGKEFIVGWLLESDLKKLPVIPLYFGWGELE